MSVKPRTILEEGPTASTSTNLVCSSGLGDRAGARTRLRSSSEDSSSVERAAGSAAWANIISAGVGAAGTSGAGATGTGGAAGMGGATGTGGATSDTEGFRLFFPPSPDAEGNVRCSTCDVALHPMHDPYEGDAVICNACNMDFPAASEVWHCRVCENFDICHMCVADAMRAVSVSAAGSSSASASVSSLKLGSRVGISALPGSGSGRSGAKARGGRARDGGAAGSSPADGSAAGGSSSEKQSRPLAGGTLTTRDASRAGGSAALSSVLSTSGDAALLSATRLAQDMLASPNLTGRALRDLTADSETFTISMQSGHGEAAVLEASMSTRSSGARGRVGGASSAANMLGLSELELADALVRGASDLAPLIETLDAATSARTMASSLGISLAGYSSGYHARGEAAAALAAADEFEEAVVTTTLAVGGAAGGAAATAAANASAAAGPDTAPKPSTSVVVRDAKKDASAAAAAAKKVQQQQQLQLQQQSDGASTTALALVSSTAALDDGAVSALADELFAILDDAAIASGGAASGADAEARGKVLRASARSLARLSYVQRTAAERDRLAHTKNAKAELQVHLNRYSGGNNPISDEALNGAYLLMQEAHKLGFTAGMQAAHKLGITDERLRDPSLWGEAHPNAPRLPPPNGGKSKGGKRKGRADVLPLPPTSPPPRAPMSPPTPMPPPPLLDGADVSTKDERQLVLAPPAGAAAAPPRCDQLELLEVLHALFLASPAALCALLKMVTLAGGDAGGDARAAEVLSINWPDLYEGACAGPVRATPPTLRTHTLAPSHARALV